MVRFTDEQASCQAKRDVISAPALLVEVIAWRCCAEPVTKLRAKAHASHHRFKRAMFKVN